MKGYYTDIQNNVLGYWDLPTKPDNTPTNLFVISEDRPPLYVSPAQSNLILVNQATRLLSASDNTMLRIQEAVALDLTTWVSADVIAWVNYRKALRAIIAAGGGTLPTKPAYPANT